MNATVTDIEEFKNARMKPVRFNTIAELERQVVIDIQGTFSTAASRILAHAILARADAVDGLSK